MIKFIFNLSKLLFLSYFFCDRPKKYKLLKRYINNSGCIFIKCIQWITPLLEKQDINNNLLNILSSVYEDNYIHDIKYTKYLYKKHFNEELLNEYEIIDVIGSGSIGQVYKIKDINTDNLYAMKVKHPEIESQILLFKRIFSIIYNIKIFNKLFYNYFPFNLVDFLQDFYKQTDFINESNNLLQFYNKYKDNKFLIIPKLIKTSKDIIIMEYIEGKCLDELDISEYRKSKIIFLLYLFIRNNMMITNYNHGDLHKFNWKISDEKYKNINKIIIYDFGYCFSNNKRELPYVKKICNLIQSYDKNKTEKVNDYKEFLTFLFDKEKLKLLNNFNHNITKPDILLKQILSISKYNNIMIKRYKVLNILLLMCLVDNYFTKYNISNEPKENIKDNLLNAYTFCNHYNIFKDLSYILLSEYNELGSQKEIFENINFGENIRKLL